MVVTVIPSDKRIIIDGNSVLIDNFLHIAEHENMRALQWNGSSGHIEWEDPSINKNTKITEDNFDIHVKPYVDNYNAYVSDQKSKYDAWYNSDEQKWERLRIKRQGLVKETDYLMLPDYPITDACREQFEIYRQALRDITSLPGAPWTDDTVPWPAKPAIIKRGI